MPSNEALEAPDLAAPERWLESQRRSRRRRFAAAGSAARRRLGRRGTVTLVAVMALGTGAATAHQSASQSTRVQSASGAAADGAAVPQTRGAIKRFQRANGLVVDGIVGPATLAALGVKARPATPAKAASASAPSATLRSIAACESGGNPSAVSADGLYRGKYQFSRSTWRSMGGRGDPAAAPEAEQDRRAAALYASQGSAPWPNCA